MKIGVLVDSLSQFKDFISRKLSDMYMFDETRACDTNKNFYFAIFRDIDMRGLSFDKFIDLRELSIDVIVSRVTSPIDATINNYKIVYNKE